MMGHCAAFQKLLFTNQAQYNVLQKPAIFPRSVGQRTVKLSFISQFKKFIQTLKRASKKIPFVP